MTPGMSMDLQEAWEIIARFRFKSRLFRTKAKASSLVFDAKPPWHNTLGRAWQLYFYVTFLGSCTVHSDKERERSLIFKLNNNDAFNAPADKHKWEQENH